MNSKFWQIISDRKEGNIIDTLLANRGIKNEAGRKEFFKPKDPSKIKIEETGISKAEVKKALKRIREAIRKKEKIIIYGDYDADGVSATAILWEALYSIYKNTLPYIPERFSEGYGLNIESIKKLKQEDPNLGLIITVDNGIVAANAVAEATKLGIDVIITDHHEPEKKKPKAYAIIHTTKIGGAGVSWFFAREIAETNSLELAAIGTIADQIPLTGINRSVVRFGLEALNKTKRPGLKSIVRDAALTPGEIGTYEVGFVIAPRLNAMGRLEHAIESLRLLCTRDSLKAEEISKEVGRVNKERQKIVEEVVIHTRENVKLLSKDKIIVIAHESYHEGVIGLAAGKLVEEFYRPAIVISLGDGVAKASARSISGFNIIKAVRSVEHLILQGGGHPMAAGFTIDPKKIKEFEREINKVSEKFLTEEVMTRKLKVDMVINFPQISWDLAEKIVQFEPFGLGNPSPVFVSEKVEVVDARTVGSGKHLKLKLKQDGSVLGAIAFGFGEMVGKLTSGTEIDLAYGVEINSWNGSREMQLKVKDIKIS